MSLARASTMTPDQARSTDPALTAWVGASAGTGKTHVLTARVLRLMLTGTPPENIVCLTFTKAAAAEMKNRIFAELGRWSVMDDEALKAEIASRAHEAADEAMLDRARQLFTRVLDLVNGFPVQTFHSFCQSLLGRFPLEAGMAPGFEGIDESDASELMATAKDRMLAATRAPLAVELQKALNMVAGLVTERTFDDVIDRLAFEAPLLARAVRVHRGVEGLMQAVYQQLGADPVQTDEDIVASACGLSSSNEAGLASLAEGLGSGSSGDVKRAQLIATWLQANQHDRVRLFNDYRGAFLTKSGTPLKTVATQAVLKVEPSFAQTIADEQERILAVEDERLRQRAATATSALLRLGFEQLRLYRFAKTERGLVDFDDMIARTVALFSQADVAPWILFKLDNQIDHILVDEAQDTNRDQWRVVETLAAEFFAGEGARDIERTIFAVGDAKQSIFSFQRADPAEFVRARDRVFERAEAAGMVAERVPLVTSFRSGEAVLSLVDKVFSEDGRAHHGLSLDGERVRHHFHRSGQAGCVELWPLETPRRAIENQESGWQLPLAQETVDDAEQRVAHHIADHIASSIGRRNLESKKRKVQPGDVLVLVRRRTAFVDHFIRALKARGVPVTGRDRMTLIDELPVMDLLVLAQFALLPDDDLALATALKSPFLGLDDDDLFALSYERRSTLWEALKTQKSSDRFGPAYEFLRQVLNQADVGGPFDFFSFVLIDLDGRKKLAQRLGTEIHESIDELLEEAMRFQFSHTPSLQTFVESLRRNNTQIKRDMEQAENRVRIMTTHSAKGLQAPIVYLSDIISTPDLTRDSRLLAVQGKDLNGPPLPVWASQARGLPEVESARNALRDRQLAEYRRLLYVALTRAEDELYIAGWRGPNEPDIDCWYSLIQEGFDRLDAVEVMNAQGQKVRRFDVPQTAKPKPDTAEVSDVQSERAAPPWLVQAMPDEPAPTRPLSPSQPEEEPAATGPLARTSQDRFRRGNILHSMLQWLPDIPQDRREAAAIQYLQQIEHLGDQERQLFWQEAAAVLNNAAFSQAFGPGSRAEVPIAGIVSPVGGGKGRAISGQVDRLVVTDKNVLVIDYKSNRPPPTDPGQVPSVYFRQMGLYVRVLESIYPDKKVTAALLWTDSATLMELPKEPMNRALEQLGL